ncbi:MAG: class B sortase [Lachnospiraceae bacterium]|nr:class B sortase [Lachnospiraceae bacterium]
MTEERKPKKRRNIGPRIVFFAALAVFIFSGVQLIRIWRDYRVADSSYEDLREEFRVRSSGGETAAEEDPDYTWLLAMHEEYPAIVGWIQIPDTNVDYPVMYRAGDDGNSYYLTHDYSGEANGNGSIFLDMANSPALDDAYSVIYGHNMKSGSMFHDITRYLDDSFWEEHPDITLLVIEDGGASVREETWRIFSAHVTVDDSDVYSFGHQNGTEAFEGFAAWLSAASGIDTGVSVTGNDRILTLSTCTNTAANERTVVHAVLLTD